MTTDGSRLTTVCMCMFHNRKAHIGMQ